MVTVPFVPDVEGAGDDGDVTVVTVPPLVEVIVISVSKFLSKIIF